MELRCLCDSQADRYSMPAKGSRSWLAGELESQLSVLVETVPGQEQLGEAQGSEGIHTDDSGEQDLVRLPGGWDLTP